MGKPAWWRALWSGRRGVVGFLMAALALPVVGLTGLSIDTARSYFIQSRLQTALDAGTLAAARAYQEASGQTAQQRTAAANAALVKYFNANFPENFMGINPRPVPTITGDNGLAMNTEARATATNVFMQVFGRPYQSLVTTSQATRASRGLELALVLDTTGSMWADREVSPGVRMSRIQALRNASGDLIEILFGSDASKTNLFIGVVPYVTSVNIGASRPGWLQELNLSLYPPNYPAGVAQWKGCIMERLNGLDLTDDPPILYTQNEPATARATRWPMFFWADTTASVDNNWIDDSTGVVTIVDNVGYSDANGRGPNISCGEEILPMTNVKQTLLDKVNGLNAWRKGGTMSHVGLAWGWRLISPHWRNAGWGHVASGLPQALPLDYENTMYDKAVVLMTDGENQFFDYTSADPPYSDFTALGRLELAVNGGHPDIDTQNQSTARQRLNAKTASLCTAMKQRGIIIYTVTFELGTSSAATEARDTFRNCATDPSYYFDAQLAASGSTVDLSSAFRSIANSLANLHLSR